MWLPKPIYEALPYYYLAAGVSSLAAAPYLDFWYWPHICLITGFTCLVAGLVVLLKRRSHRQHLAETHPDHVASDPPTPGHPHEV